MLPGEELHKGRTKARWNFLACSCTYVLSSLLPLSFSSLLSCLWTAVCLTNGNIDSFPLLLYSILLIFTLVHSMFKAFATTYCLFLPKAVRGMSAWEPPLSKWTSHCQEGKSDQQHRWQLSVFWAEQPRNSSPQFTVPFRYKKCLLVPIQWVTLRTLSYIQWTKMV